MPDATGALRTLPPIAIVGLACRFPDADDPAALLDVVLTGRRSFRRLPPVRVELADYYQPDRATSDATYSTRAGLIEGWQFEPSAFGIDEAAYAAADPAHWLALETAARALAAAGLPAGTGLDRDRTGVIIGNTLTGDASRANALRVRWPFVRRVLTEALGADDIPAGQASLVLRRAEIGYLAPFPAMGPESLAGSMPGTIAAGISTHFGFRGGSHAVDSACSSSLQAVASASAALSAGELDAAIAGGVDLSMDPLELIGLAKAGLLADSDMRIYDKDPAGYLPGEGCGVVVLMRSADARTAGLPVYAEILGWGTSGGGKPGEVESHASSQLLAMQRAYERSGIDPAEITYLEGNGAGTRLGDEAELTALASIRSGSAQLAALGSVKANIGHAQAAAGAAGLIKTVLALGTGVVPPTTGSQLPHELIASGDARVTLPETAREWPSGPRLAAVSTMGIGGSNVHVVLRHEPAGRARQDRWLRSVPILARATMTPGLVGQARLLPAPEPMPFLLHAPDRFALAAVLSRIAEIGPWLSDAEMADLACLLGRDTAAQGSTRVAIVAARQSQLAMLAREAITMLPLLADGLMAVRPGVFASDSADGRVTLLLSAEQAAAQRPDASHPDATPSDATLSAVSDCLDALRWLESLGVHANVAVAHGLGALAGLAWAGVLGETEVVEIAELRAQFLTRSASRNATSGLRDGSGDTAAAEAELAASAARSTAAAAPAAEMQIGAVTGQPSIRTAQGSATGHPGSAELRAAIAQRFRFGPPRRRLISTLTGTEVGSVDEAIELICSGFATADPVAESIAAGAIGATLLAETGPGRALVTAAAEVTKVPAISLEAGLHEAASTARVAAALYAAGALGEPQPLFARRQTRTIDIWRERVFLTSPCNIAPARRADTAQSGAAAVTELGDQNTTVAAAKATAATPDTGVFAPAADTAAADTAAADEVTVAADSLPVADTVPAAETVSAADPAEAAATDVVATADAGTTADASAATDPAATTGADAVASADAGISAEAGTTADTSTTADATDPADTTDPAGTTGADAVATADAGISADADTTADPSAVADTSTTANATDPADTTDPAGTTSADAVASADASISADADTTADPSAVADTSTTANATDPADTTGADAVATADASISGDTSAVADASAADASPAEDAGSAADAAAAAFLATASAPADTSADPADTGSAEGLQPATADITQSAETEATAKAPATAVPSTIEADGSRVVTDEDSISSRRDEFERRLPAHPLIAAATGAVATGTAATSAGGTGATVTGDVTSPRGPSDEYAVNADEPALNADEPAVLADEPVITDEPALLAVGSAVPADQVSVPLAPPPEPVDGLSTWTRCFTERLRPAPRPAMPAEALPWRMFAAARSATLADLSGLFTADPTVSRTLAIVDDPTDERSRATAVEAGQDALTTGELVVLTTSAGFTGFFASLHAEHPSIGVTILRVPADVDIAPAAIQQFTAAEPGSFRELVLGEAGTVCEPVLAEVPLAGGGDFPLGPDDVILISRETRGAGLALAQVLAICGTGIAFVGRPGEYDDDALIAGLEELRSAGARVSYEIIDITDPLSLTAAVKRIEDRLGPVTAVAHGAAADDLVSMHEIRQARITEHLGDASAMLDQLAGAIRAGQLKMIITFGSVIGRYGMAGAGSHALSSSALARRAAQLADASIGCRALHVDLPAWDAGGLGDRPGLAAELAASGTTPLGVAGASRLLLKVMTTPGLPRDVAIHGRVDGLAAAAAPALTVADLSAAGLAGGGRFVREVTVHYRGIELVASARLALDTDPYLADYRVDGLPVLPPVLALEALAQAASVLAGRPLRRAVRVTLDSPVAVPPSGEAELRIHAQRDGDTVVTALRCSDSSYLVDHARAEFSCAAELSDSTDAPSAAASAALHQLVAGPAGLVDGAELYGPICFQSGRFRRIALLPEITARSGRALARGPDEEPWFGADSELAGTTFLLGSPGLNDAALQVLQACVPHRRVRARGCESVQFSGQTAQGPVEIRAIAAPVRQPAAGDDQAGLVPGQAGPPAAESAAPPANGTTTPAPPVASSAPGVAITAAADSRVASPAAPASPVGSGAVRPAVMGVTPAEMTPEERADMEIAERRPQSRKSRRASRRSGEKRYEQRQAAGALMAAALPRGPESGQRGAKGSRSTGDDQPGSDTMPIQASPVALRPVITGSGPAQGSAAGTAGGSAPSGEATVADGLSRAVGAAFGAGAARADLWSAAPGNLPAPALQRWDVDAVDATGQLLAAWRGVQLHDSGPLPRNAAWPPTLLSVFLERRAVDLGLDESLRVAVSCGQPETPPPDLLGGVPQQALPADGSAASIGRHAGPERKAVNAANSPGAGALSGFRLTLRAPVSVACGWAAVETGHRLHEPDPGLAQACAQLRAELAESPEVIAARLEAITSCAAMAHLLGGSRRAGQLSVARTTGDGWALLTAGRASIACAVVELSGVAAPVAIALLTRQHAHARERGNRAEVPVSS